MTTARAARTWTQADVVLVGVSRTSKTPTCIYLAHRGVRAANVPLVPGRPPPEELFTLKNTLVVGLMTSPERLIQIRRNRLLSLKENRESNYIDTDAVRQEIIAARRLFERQGWPIIDVTRRSVEETAAAIINLLLGRSRPGRGAGMTSRPAPPSPWASPWLPERGPPGDPAQRRRRVRKPSAPASTRTPPRPALLAEGLAARGGRRPGRAEGVQGLDQAARPGSSARTRRWIWTARCSTRSTPSRPRANGCSSCAARSTSCTRPWSWPATAGRSGGGGRDRQADRCATSATPCSTAIWRATRPTSCRSVGCYLLEDEGVQLFDRIDGDYFTILGLPLMGLFDFLRLHGALEA